MRVKFNNTEPVRQVTTNRRPEPGVYTVVVDDLKQGATQSGNPKLDAKFVIADGPLKGSRLYNIFTFGESQVNMFARFIRACVGGDLPESVDLDQVAPYIGTVLLVRVNHEQQGNMTYTRCRDFYLSTETDQAKADVEEDDKITVRKSSAAPVQTAGGF